MTGEREEKVGVEHKEKSKRPPRRWIQLGASVYSDPTRGGEYLGTVRQILDEKGTSPKTTEDGRKVSLEFSGGSYVPEVEAYYYYFPGLGGWVLKPSPERPKSTTEKRERKQIKVGQLGLGREFSEIPRVLPKRK